MSCKGNYFLRAVAYFENLNCINVDVTKIALIFSFVCHTSSICGNLQVNNTHKYKTPTSNFLQNKVLAHDMPFILFGVQIN